MTTLIEQLKIIAALKTGEPIPPLFDNPNGWGEALSQICGEAARQLEFHQRQPKRHDPLAGSDSYDILSGTAQLIEATLTQWSRLEHHELVQIPDWPVRISELLAAAAREIGRLKADKGAESPGPSFNDLKREIRNARLEALKQQIDNC